MILSTPGAIPACGGAPYWNALYNAGNFDSTTDLNFSNESNGLNQLQIRNLMDLISSIMDKEIIDYEKSKLIFKKTLSNIYKNN